MQDCEIAMSTKTIDISAERLLQMVEILKGISHPLRLHIIMLLCTREHGVSEMAEVMGEKQALVSQHLSRLRLINIVSVERKGGKATYSLKEPLLRNLVKCLTKCEKA